MTWIPPSRLDDLLKAKPDQGPITRGEFVELVTRYKGMHPDSFMEELETQSANPFSYMTEHPQSTEKKDKAQ